MLAASWPNPGNHCGNGSDPGRKTPHAGRRTPTQQLAMGKRAGHRRRAPTRARQVRRRAKASTKGAERSRQGPLSEPVTAARYCTCARRYSLSFATPDSAQRASAGGRPASAGPPTPASPGFRPASVCCERCWPRRLPCRSGPRMVVAHGGSLHARPCSTRGRAARRGRLLRPRARRGSRDSMPSRRHIGRWVTGGPWATGQGAVGGLSIYAGGRDEFGVV